MFTKASRLLPVVRRATPLLSQTRPMFRRTQSLPLSFNQQPRRYFSDFSGGDEEAQSLYANAGKKREKSAAKASSSNLDVSGFNASQQGATATASMAKGVKQWKNTSLTVEKGRVKANPFGIRADPIYGTLSTKPTENTTVSIEGSPSGFSSNTGISPYIKGKFGYTDEEGNQTEFMTSSPFYNYIPKKEEVSAATEETSTQSPEQQSLEQVPEQQAQAETEEVSAATEETSTLSTEQPSTEQVLEQQAQAETERVKKMYQDKVPGYDPLSS